MSKAAAPQIELASADPDIAQEMARWLSHLGTERRLSPKTLEAYARDLRQCLAFLSQHWGARVTLKTFAAVEASDIRAFMAMRRAAMKALISLASSAAKCGNVTGSPQCPLRNTRHCFRSRA